jgi:hypothetical protein
MNKLILAILVILAAASDAGAQMRGMGRIQGTVTDMDGAPLSGVSISAKNSDASASITSKSDDKGVWYVAGLARGDWQVEFDKAGYDKRHAKVVLPVELARAPPIVITMKKAS